VLKPGRHEGVEGAVERRIGHRPDVLGNDRSDLVEPLEHLLALLERARPARDEREEGLSLAILGDERQWRRDPPGGEAPERLGNVLDEVAVEAEDGPSVLELVEHRAAVDLRDRVEPELELGDDAEVPAAAPQRPEEVVVLRLAGTKRAAVRGHDLGRHEVVAGETDAAGEIADPATERQATHPGVEMIPPVVASP
jgi:hypothetical protein